MIRPSASVGWREISTGFSEFGEAPRVCAVASPRPLARLQGLDRASLPGKTYMNEPEELRELTSQLKRLVDKLEIPKKRDFWDRIPVITSFLSSVLIAGLGVLLTAQIQRMESARQKQFQDAQIVTQRTQLRIEELKALTSLAPLLASTDSSQRSVGRQLLQAVAETSTYDPALVPFAGHTAPADGKASGAAPEPDQSRVDVARPAGTASLTTLIDRYARIALASNASVTERVEATREIGNIAVANTTPTSVRAQAIDAATKIATTPGVPTEVQRTAAEIVAGIKSVPPDRIATIIRDEPIDRAVDEVVLHHSATPSAMYRGASTIFSIAKFQTAEQRWSRVSWHYAIAPDGMIWLGMRLTERAIHVPRHNDSSVSVLLIMDGNQELPGEDQRRSLGLVLRAISARLGIPPETSLRFHSDYDSRRQCPGSKLDKASVLEWIGE